MNGFTSLLWFAAVLAAIPLVLWLFKRSALGGMAGNVPGAPRPVAVLALSPQQRLVTVEVGQGDERLWLVLGVSPQGIQTLHTMAAQTVATPPGAAPAPAAAFSQLLGRLKQGGPGSDAR
jgi:flagellar protein FliO/FliZ